MSDGFGNFLKRIQPPPDGTYLFRVQEVRPSTYELRVTLEVVDGDYAGRVVAVSLHHVHDLRVLQQFVRAIRADDVEDARTLRGRMLYAAVRQGDSRVFLGRPEPYDPSEGGPTGDGP
jgi:hypothetical protein